MFELPCTGSHYLTNLLGFCCQEGPGSQEQVKPIGYKRDKSKPESKHCSVASKLVASLWLPFKTAFNQSLEQIKTHPHDSHPASK